MDKRDITSPAHRLRQFLLRGQEDRNVANNERGSQYVAKAFSIGDDDLLKLYKCFAHVFETVGQVKRGLEASDNIYAKTCIPAIDRILRALTQMSVHQQWNVVSKGISSSDMDLLSIACNIFEEQEYEQTPTTEELDGLRIKIQETATAIQGEETLNNVNLIVIDLLDELGALIEDFENFGVDGLKAVLEKTYGRLFLEREIIVPHKDTQPLRKLWDALGAINSLVATLTNADRFGNLLEEFIEKSLGG